MSQIVRCHYFLSLFTPAIRKTKLRPNKGRRSFACTRGAATYSWLCHYFVALLRQRRLSAVNFPTYLNGNAS
uniref:Uncharacterized protein n=1 Tax=Myoviridae sp. ct2AC8 TaxID=2827655 RepID=A0A8S5TPX2_9CAUD|nr:MAG TPA: hypothetical protein [Myoviridae sp. ct2AC8]